MNDKKEELKLEIRLLKDNLRKMDSEIGSLNKKEEEIKGSEEYEEFINLSGKGQDLSIELKNQEDKIVSEFSIFSRPFKKYAKAYPKYESMIKKYLEDPVSALIDDRNLEIISILDEMSKVIISENLCSKEKKIRKVMEQIKRLNREYLKGLKDEYIKKKEEKKDIEERVAGNAAEKELEEIAARTSQLKEKIESKKSEISTLEKGLETINDEENWKRCPKCGEKIQKDWDFHKECGWKRSDENDDERIGKAKITVFTSPTCPHCPSAVRLAKDIEKERDDVKVIEMSTATPQGQRKAQQMGVMAVPTVFVKGPSNPQNIGFKGTPSKKNLLKAIDISLGRSEWEERKGFFQGLIERFRGKA